VDPTGNWRFEFDALYVNLDKLPAPPSKL